MGWLPKRSVVVPFDFSEASMAAMQLATTLVEDSGHVHVVHVLPTLMLDEAGIYPDCAEDERRRKRIEAAFRKRTEAFDLKNVAFQCRIGDPAREVVACAEETKAELIVIPSHGRTSIDRWWLGSVAECVVRLAHCPVLVLKARLTDTTD